KMFRKHLGWYIEQAPWPSDPLERRAAKSRLCRLETPEEICRALAELWAPVAQTGNSTVDIGSQLAEAGVG
ncbi:MAG TPA: tRNA dihydrouridine synthase DusB, partial [Brevundimonas sp.]|nr:tRNA dihydrouridine synthase DusB [Brevundimonas sp.]